MNEFQLYTLLKESWDTSTKSDNQCLKAIKKISWEYNWYEEDDEEYYFRMNEFLLVTAVLDPFEAKKRPTVICRTDMVSL